MNNLLEQKIALENLWTKIILQDIEAVKNKIHNQI